MVLLILAMLAIPVSAENVYVDRNPAIFDVKPADFGYAVFHIKAGGSAADLTIWIENKALNLTKFDASWHPDGTKIIDQNKGYLQVEILPDGLSEPVILQKGEYLSYLQNGNGNQLETKEFKIGNGATEHIEFLGSAVATINHTPPQCIIQAHWEYRFRDWVPEGLEYICTEEVNHTETVIDAQEWDEQIWHPEVNHTVHHPEVNHTVHHDAITRDQWVEDGHYYIYDWKWYSTGWSGYWKVKCTNHAEHGEGWHIPTSACAEAYGHWETVVVVPAWDELIVDEQAWDELVIDSQEWIETIHHNAITHQIIVVDEPAYCEWVVVSEGYWMEWSMWSTEQPFSEKGREIESKWVEKINNCCCNCNEEKPQVILN